MQYSQVLDVVEEGIEWTDIGNVNILTSVMSILRTSVMSILRTSVMSILRTSVMSIVSGSRDGWSPGLPFTPPDIQGLDGRRLVPSDVLEPHPPPNRGQCSCCTKQ